MVIYPPFFFLQHSAAQQCGPPRAWASMRSICVLSPCDPRTLCPHVRIQSGGVALRVPKTHFSRRCSRSIYRFVSMQHVACRCKRTCTCTCVFLQYLSERLPTDPCPPPAAQSHSRPRLRQPMQWHACVHPQRKDEADERVHDVHPRGTRAGLKVAASHHYTSNQQQERSRLTGSVRETAMSAPAGPQLQLQARDRIAPAGCLTHRQPNQALPCASPWTKNPTRSRCLEALTEAAQYPEARRSGPLMY